MSGVLRTLDQLEAASGLTCRGQAPYFFVCSVLDYLWREPRKHEASLGANVRGLHSSFARLSKFMFASDLFISFVIER